MRQLVLLLLSGLLAVATVPLHAQSTSPPYLEAKRGVVLIDTGAGIGTGFVISPSMIATACHVVRGAAAIQVQFWFSGQRASGRLVVCNERHDVGVIAAAVPEGAAILPFAERIPAQGDRVWVWGYPLGTRIAAEPSLASGIVSAVSAAEGTFAVDVSGGPGNSGGPVLDDDGRVVGILLGDWTDRRQGSTGFKHAVVSATVTPLLSGVASAAPPTDPAATAAAEQAAIRPGSGIGPVRLEMTPAQVEAALSVPPSRRLSNGWMEWEGRALWVYFASGRAVMIDTEDRTLATPEGIRVGSTDTDLIRAYGAPTCSSVRDLRGQAYLGWYYSGLFVFLKGSPRQVFGIRVIAATAADRVCR